MSSPNSKTSCFHPALAVTNIKNFIPLALDMENVQYSSWSELFKITARAYEVLDHILPSPADEASSSATPPAAATISQRLEQDAAHAEALALWTRLDSIVLQWIYGTISMDLLHTILVPDSTAQRAWERLADIFQDNKNSRAVHLETQFSNTRLEQFPTVAAYCQTLKTIADNLANVDSPVDERRLVLRMVHGLPEQYNTIASLIQQTTPLPDFFKARSMIKLEETRMAQQTTPTVTALVHSAAPPTAPAPAPRGRGSSSRGGRGRSSRGGRGRSNGRPEAPSTSGQWYWMPSPPWTPPPCPYPTTAWNGQSSQPSSGAGILGTRPQQAYITAPTVMTPTPTALPTAMQSLTLTPPDDQWYMDTGATSHMTGNSGSPNGHPSHAM
ncbi:unnamed protein product [Cuscuta epithymum]|uniref:Uncharacterized protein n=1 Tax=Cuscuta epithymum TaxID=186058 RepID=A0AAV0G254_9ASTE|nr:unnamed protein product [Cuscuta epithymum]